MLKGDDIRTITRYRERFEKHGYSPETLGWNKKRQAVRFAAAIKGLEIKSISSIIDVGCGFGDLYSFLVKQAWNGAYIGFDITEELITYAQKRYSSVDNTKFINSDITCFKDERKVEAGFALGMFNYKLEQDNYVFFEEVIEKLFSLTSKVIVCDFMGCFVDFEAPNLFYADPMKVSKIVRQYTKKYLIDFSYMPYEFQVKMWHDDDIDKEFNVFSDYKEYVNFEF